MPAVRLLLPIAIVAGCVLTVSLAPSPPVAAQLADGQGGMRLTIVATPETASTVVPSVSLAGNDVFATNCVEDPTFSSVTSEVVYDCSGLDLAIYDVTAAPVGGVEPSLSCSPVGSFDGFDPAVADVAVDGFVYCTLFVAPPGVRFFLSGIDTANELDVDVTGAGGQPVDVECRRSDRLPQPGFATLHCDPLPLGTYSVAPQDVDGSGVVQPWVCAPGIGQSNGPDLDNTFVLAEPIDELDERRTVWSCSNEEPFISETAIDIGLRSTPTAADAITIGLRQNGVDVPASCAPTPPPAFIDGDPDLQRYERCVGDWSGEIEPYVDGVPDGFGVAVRCFEQNPVSTIIGPVAIFGDEHDLTWLCSLTVLPPHVLVFDQDIDRLVLTTDDGRIVEVSCVDLTPPDRSHTVRRCSPLTFAPYEIDVDASGLPADTVCFPEGAFEGPPAPPTLSFGDVLFWSCDSAELLGVDVPQPVTTLPETGTASSGVAWWAVTFVGAGAALVLLGRRRRPPAPTRVTSS